VPGTTLTSTRGNYIVGALIGDGQYGSVYECLGPFDQPYALKMLRPANKPYPVVKEEWSLEMRRLESFRHPNIVYIHDAFENNFLFYLALERCDTSLKALMSRARPIPQPPMPPSSYPAPPAPTMSGTMTGMAGTMSGTQTDGSFPPGRPPARTIPMPPPMSLTQSSPGEPSPLTRQPTGQFSAYPPQSAATYAMPSDLVIELSRQLLMTLQYLHDNGVVHSDLHAGNVLISQVDRAPIVKLTDFGVAHQLGGGERWFRPRVANPKILTPELVTAGYTTTQSDLYQLGLILYQMHTGLPAMDVNASYEDIARQIQDGYPRMKAEALGTPLGSVIAKLLRRRDAHRYQSAREVWDDLRKVPRW
jgi:serine/threonine protein kinase